MLNKLAAMKKVSALLVTMMLLSILTPVLAAAANFAGVTYDGNNVSGTVYSKTYAQDGLQVHVYGPDDTFLKIVTATYASYNPTTEEYKYTLNSEPVSDTIFSKIKLKEKSEDTSEEVSNVDYQPYITSLTVDKPSYTVKVDESVQAIVSAMYSEETQARDVTNLASYTPVDSSIVTVVNGLITGVAVGTTDVTVGLGTFSKTVSVVVTANDNGGPVEPQKPYATAISVDSQSYSLRVNETHNTVVKATYSDNTTPDVTKFATYASKDASVATVNSQGVVTALRAGTSVISVTYATYTKDVNVQVISSTSNGGGGGGGGGNSTNSDGSINVTNGQVDATTLKNAFASKSDVTLVVKGETVTIPGSALVDAAKKSDSKLTIKGDYGTYVLPLSLLNLDALAKELGVAVSDLKITVNIKKLSGDAAKPVSDAVKALGGKALADAVDFSITVEGKDGKKVNISSFSDYVKRSIPLTSTPGTNATGVLYDPVTGTFSFVPATFSNNEATFFRTGNSVYTVIETSKTFSDIAGHWAKKDIELLASKLIVNGVTDTTFEADRNITRAEFAALVVRALGLSPVASAAKFSDVKSADWYAGVVGAAAQAGIVNGYEDGSFHPNAQITREELAAMVVRAYEFADGKIAIDQAAITKALSNYSDSNKIVWGQKEVAVALTTGLVNGMTDTTLGTSSEATRAQAVTMLTRLLAKAKFVD
ncbi:S-layer homology domain-containing protein [Paenibacillus ginsengarvi]|nr:S-layer homology domain-containing protein [Paenibacillus ginsengarvi]